MADPKGYLRKIENKIFDGGKLTEEEEAFLKKKINEYWEDHPDVVNRYPRWKKFIAWVAGYQIMDYNKMSKKLVEVPIKRKRKIIFNKLRPFVRQLLAKLTADTPQMSVIPNTDDFDDIEAARVGSKVVEFLGEKINFTGLLNDCKLWLIICNRAFLRVFWSEDDTGVMGYNKVEEEIDEMTGDVANPEMVGAVEPIEADGDVVMEAISPFNCRVDPLNFTHERWRWFLFGEEVDADEIEDEYDLEPGSLVSVKLDVLDTAYDLELQDESDIIIGSPDKQEDITGRTVVFKEFWTPRIYIFTAGKKLLEYGKNEYEEIPYYAMEDRLVPIENYEKGFTYNEGLIKDAIPVQREYNRQISIFSLALDRASKLKIMTPLGSLLNKKQWTNDYGVFIDYNPKAGIAPFQAKMDDLPNALPMYTDRVERELESVFSVHEASFGRLPERASHASGTLVNLLLEQDDVVLSPLLNMINRASSKAWTLALKMVQDNYTESRLIRYTGDDGTNAVMKFKGADLKGNTDVKVTSQTGLPSSRALKVEYLMKLRESQLLMDDKATLEMMEFGQAEKIFKDELLHERRAYRENDKIESNPEISVEEVIGQQNPETGEYEGGWIHQLEDKAAHLKINLRLRFSPKFERLNSNQQQALEALIMMRYQKQMEEMMQQMQMQQQAMAEQPQEAPQ